MWPFYLLPLTEFNAFPRAQEMEEPVASPKLLPAQAGHHTSACTSLTYCPSGHGLSLAGDLRPPQCFLGLRTASGAV